MTGGLKEKKIMHSFSRAMNIHFCLTRILLHAHFVMELEVQEGIFGSDMRNRYMEDAQGSYSDEEEIIRLHVSMGNAEIASNGRRSKVDTVVLAKTMRSIQREV